jgi:ribonuclease Z
MADRQKFSDRSGVPAEAIAYSDFIVAGKWNVDDVLRPIYKEASEVLGREFKYPGDE